MVKLLYANTQSPASPTDYLSFIMLFEWESSILLWLETEMYA